MKNDQDIIIDVSIMSDLDLKSKSNPTRLKASMIITLILHIVSISCVNMNQNNLQNLRYNLSSWRV